MKFLKVELRKSENVKKYLRNNNYLDDSIRFTKDKEFLYFPLNEEFSEEKVIEKFEFCEVIEKEGKKLERNKPLKDCLKGLLTEEELEIVVTAYDLVGTIAIMEIPEELEEKGKIIAETLLHNNKTIKTVVKKISGHEGIFRIQEYKVLAGEKTKETIHKENKVELKLDIEKVYYSSRSATERKRVSELIKESGKKEKILVMFAGCGPFVCVIAKNNNAEVTGIEMNPDGHKYALENIKLNKLKNATALLGDVREVIPGIKEKFDRIIMPLPHTADEFLDTAFEVSKKGTIIHLYDFLNEDEIPSVAFEKIERNCKKYNKKYKILNVVKCGQFSPKKFRVCTDFKLS